jgi:geranylgeranyl diphosphate synthase type II
LEIIQQERIAALADGAIDACLSSVDLPRALVEAIRYAALGPGKRVRPILAWHACVASGGQGPESLPAGASVELIHAFSLVHDDLPALDNDDLRRGRPTLHRHTSEAMAILAGDAMLTLAFLPLIRANLSPAQSVAMIRELVGATTGMIAGQVYDSLGDLPASLDPEERVILIHKNKTGALIRASCVMGCLSAPDAGARTLAAITRYADAIGLMYQIVDDLLDVTRSTAEAGKRTGKDAEAGKATYPGVLGVEGSRARVQALLGEALDATSGLGPGADGLVAIAHLLASRER